jgi:tetratricopeptide (TPR) repeat protein
VVDDADIRAGDVLDGKYRILRRIGSGGMGAVFAARRVSLDDMVAIKCILREQNTRENRARFLREARAAARIRHPNVVQIFDFGGDSEVPYMVMEHLDGRTLSSALRRGRLDVDHARAIFGQICRAAEAGHRRGVVHRDLKPGNVILARGDDGREVVKVLDFGLARVLAAPDATVLTTPGSLLGTCHYMAPEQLDGMPGTVATDVYALGVVLFQLVTGELPFDGPTRIATMMRIAEGNYKPASMFADVPPEIDAAIAAALTPDPTRRPESAELLAQLAGCALGHAARESLPALDDFDSGDLEDEREDLVTQVAAPQTIGGPTTGTLDEAQFVGRDRELEGLGVAFTQCAPPRSESPPISVVTGEPGVGKTRLLEEFLQWARAQGAAVFRGRCFSYEGDRPPPYETFLWMLDGTREAVGAHARPGGAVLEPGDDRWSAFARITEEFGERAGRRTLVIGLDDLQWATALELEFLTYIQRTRPTMIVGTARVGASVGRDSELGRWLLDLTRQRALRRWPLEPLGEPELRQWLNQGLGRVQIRSEDLRRIAHVTGGNPYYVREMVRQLISDEFLTRTGEFWTCRSLVDAELPESLATLVRARLEMLPDDLLPALQMAAVVGEEFRFETLLEALEGDEDVLDKTLEQAAMLGVLTDKGISAGSDYRFASAGTREVLYGDLSRRKRKRLHQRVVDALTRLYADADAPRIAKVLAYHHHAMGNWETTAHWALIAARAMAGRDIDNTAISIRRAREAAGFLDAEGGVLSVEDAIDLDLLEGELLAIRGQYDRAQLLLGRATRRAATSKDTLRELAGLLTTVSCEIETGEYVDAVEDGRRAIEIASRIGVRDAEARARCSTAAALARMGEHDAAETLLEIGAPLPSDAALASVIVERANVELRRSQLETALSRLREAERIIDGARDVWVRERILSTRARIALHGGLLETALAAADEALALARRHSRRRAEGTELLTIAEAALELGDRGRAMAAAKDAESIFVEVDDASTQGCAAIVLGRAFVALDRQQAGRAALRRGRELVRKTRRADYHALAVMSLGHLRVDEGDIDAALELLVNAAERLEALRSPWRWRSELELARAWHRGGNDRTALDHARRAEAMLIELHHQAASLGTTPAHAVDDIQQLMSKLATD